MYRSIDTLFSMLVYQYFAPPSCVLFISEPGLNNILVNMPLGVISVKVDASHDISRQTLGTLGCQNIIINVKDSKKVFEEVEGLIWSSVEERFNNRKYLIVDNGDGLKVFESAALKFVTNVVLMQVDLGDCTSSLVLKDCHLVVNFWTNVYPEIAHSILVDKWFVSNKSFLWQKNLFYDKVSQQNGRNILAGVFDYRPYIILDEEFNITSGLEIRLLKEIVNFMNATLKVVFQEELWGDVFSNKSGYGLRGNLFLDKLDVGAAGLFMTYSALENFDLSRFYVKAELTCLVPAPRLAAAWLSPTYSFSPTLWFDLFKTYAALLIFVYLLNYYQSYIRNPFKLNVPKATLLLKTIQSVCKPLISINFSRKSYYFKPLLGLVLLCTLIIGVAYNAGFASVLTKLIYTSSISSMQDFLESDIRWGGLQTADYIFTWKTSEQALYRKAAQRYVGTTADNLEDLFLNNRNFAFKVERVNGQYNVPSYILEEGIHNYVTMKDPINFQYVVLTFRKNSVLMPLANKVIGRLVDSGIILHWTEEYSGHRHYVLKEKLKYANNMQNDEHVALTLSHVVSAFFLLCFGNLIASIVFMFELLLKRQKQVN